MIDIPFYSHHRDELMAWGDYREYKSMKLFLFVCVRKLLSYTHRKYHTQLVDAGVWFQNPGILIDDLLISSKIKSFLSTG